MRKSQTSTPRLMGSAYMNWAKTQSQAPFNLATSGVVSYPLDALGIQLEDLELSRAGSYGYAPLQQALASHCDVSIANVVAANGTSMANHLAMAAMLEPGDEVLLEHPTYELLLSTLEYLQTDVRRFQRSAASGFVLDPDEVKRCITPRTRLIVITNLHNPSGALAETGSLREIGGLARRAGARVLVDEVYLDAAFDRAPRSAFHLGPEFVVTNSLTKVYGLSGLRCGWILAEADLARRMWLLDDLFDVNQAHVTERLSLIALAKIDVIRARSRALLEANRRVLNDFLSTRSDLEARPLEYGTVCLPKLLTGPVDRFCELLRAKYGATVVPGSVCERPEYFRIGIGGETAGLVSSLERLGAALDEFCSK